MLVEKKNMVLGEADLIRLTWRARLAAFMSSLIYVVLFVCVVQVNGLPRTVISWSSLAILIYSFACLTLMYGVCSGRTRWLMPFAVIQSLTIIVQAFYIIVSLLLAAQLHRFPPTIEEVYRQVGWSYETALKKEVIVYQAMLVLISSAYGITLVTALEMHAFKVIVKYKRAIDVYRNQDGSMII